MSRLLDQAADRKKGLKKAKDSDRDPADLGPIESPPWEEPKEQPQGEGRRRLNPVPEPSSEGDPGGDGSSGPKGDPQSEVATSESPVSFVTHELPPEDAPTVDIITAASRVIYDAVVRFEDGERKLADRLFEEAGPAVRLVHKTKAHRELKDPETGQPYRSFRKWATGQGISKSNAYRMINELPVREALQPLYTGALPAGHLDVLAPILRQHGAKAVREVWATAEAGAKAARNGGRPTVQDLIRARQILGLETSPENDEPPAVSDPAKTFRSVQKALKVLADTGALRIAMQYNPQETRELLRQAMEIETGREAAGIDAVPEVSQVGTPVDGT